jgi:hypothetical protein
MLKQYFFKQTKRAQYITAGLAMLLVAAVGTSLLIGSHAASPAVSTTAASGTLSSGVTQQACSGASTGNCVTFGSGTSVTCPLSSFTASNQPACLIPFTSNSPFNTQLPSNPKLASNSATIVSHMATYKWQFQGSPSGLQISPSSRPVFFAHPSDPLIKITACDAFGSGSCTGINGVNILGTSFHVPQGAQAYGNTDGHFTVVETDTGNEYDFWQASVNWSNNTMTASAGGMENITTDTGVAASDGDAANFPLLAGLIRPSELLAGKINHALVIDVGCTTGYVWPAPSWVGNNPCSGSEDNATTPAMGQLFKLSWSDSQIASSGAPSWELAIMYALAHYGAYVEDVNGSNDDTIYLFTQSSNSWTDLGTPDQWATVDAQLPDGTGGSNPSLQSKVPIPASALEVVDPCVPQHQC